MDDLIYTVAEVAEILKLSPQSVRSLIKNNEIGYIIVGKSYRISSNSLIEFINKKQE